MGDHLKVLIVEDEPNVRLGCQQTLELEGMAVLAVESAEKARQLVAADFPGVVVTDIRLPGDDGMALMHDLLRQDRDLPVVLMTGHGDVSLAVQAMKDGAHDFIEKPFSPDYFVEIVRRALEKRTLTLEVRELRARLENRQSTASRIIGDSAAIERVRHLIGELGNSAADVLIQGETGTGKSSSRAACMMRAQGVAAISSPSIAAACLRTCSTAKSSAMSLEPSPAPPSAGSARSSTPMAARCFSTR